MAAMISPDFARLPVSFAVSECPSKSVANSSLQAFLFSLNTLKLSRLFDSLMSISTPSGNLAHPAEPKSLSHLSTSLLPLDQMTRLSLYASECRTFLQIRPSFAMSVFKYPKRYSFIQKPDRMFMVYPKCPAF